jgi:hypothetical protein
MLRFVVAVAPEADALVRRYRMELQEGAFRWYRSEAAALVISGVGKTAAAAATGYLHAKTGEEPLGVWLNFGTAGHRDRPRGDLVLAHTVRDAASGESFHPTLLDGPDLEAVEIRTVERPEVEFDSDALYDMEAYGFVATAIRFSTSELVQSIKIVSDNRGTTAAAWTPEAVRDLVEERADDVVGAAERFREIARDLEPLRRAETETKELVGAFRDRARFTTSEARRLARLLVRWAALEPGAVLRPENIPGASSAEILDGLERRLRNRAAERSL